METPTALDLTIAALHGAEEASAPSWTQSDVRCYELVEEMGAEGFSCLVYAGTSRQAARGDGKLTFCQLRRNDGERLGCAVPGAGPARAREAVCRAYLAFRLRLRVREADAAAAIRPLGR